jgi:DNA repair exonuclease SbcCD nuclease subunit
MPRTPILALTSDWHLQRGAWRRANTPQGDSRYALRQIAAHCVEHRLDLIGAGDLFDDLQPDTGTLEAAYSGL